MVKVVRLLTFVSLDHMWPSLKVMDGTLHGRQVTSNLILVSEAQEEQEVVQGAGTHLQIDRFICKLLRFGCKGLGEEAARLLNPPRRALTGTLLRVAP